MASKTMAVLMGSVFVLVAGCGGDSGSVGGSSEPTAAEARSISAAGVAVSSVGFSAGIDFLTAAAVTLELSGKSIALGDQESLECVKSGDSSTCKCPGGGSATVTFTSRIDRDGECFDEVAGATEAASITNLQFTRTFEGCKVFSCEGSVEIDGVDYGSFTATTNGFVQPDGGGAVAPCTGFLEYTVGASTNAGELSEGESAGPESYCDGMTFTSGGVSSRGGYNLNQSLYTTLFPVEPLKTFGMTGSVCLEGVPRVYDGDNPIQKLCAVEGAEKCLERYPTACNESQGIFENPACGADEVCSPVYHEYSHLFRCKPIIPCDVSENLETSNHRPFFNEFCRSRVPSDCPISIEFESSRCALGLTPGVTSCY